MFFFFYVEIKNASQNLYRIPFTSSYFNAHKKNYAQKILTMAQKTSRRKEKEKFIETTFRENELFDFKFIIFFYWIQINLFMSLMSGVRAESLIARKKLN